MRKQLKHIEQQFYFDLKYCILFFFSVLLISCETQTDWDFKTEELPLIIAEGIITNEIKAKV